MKHVASPCLLLNISLNNLLLFDWTVSRADFGLLDRLDHIIAAHYFTENRIAHIEPWCRDSCDKKLTAVGVRARVRHREKSGFVEFPRRCNLISNRRPPNAFPAA